MEQTSTDRYTTLDEQAFDLVWRSPELPSGDHFVRIIHEAGNPLIWII